MQPANDKAVYNQAIHHALLHNYCKPMKRKLNCFYFFILASAIVLEFYIYSLLDNEIHILRSKEIFHFLFSHVSTSSIDMQFVFLLYYFELDTSLHFAFVCLPVCLFAIKS